MKAKEYSSFEPWYFCKDSTSCSDPTENKLLSFANLPEGWNYGEGSPPTERTVHRAIEIYKVGKSYGLDCEVFPVSDGCIEVSLYRNKYFIDILVKGDGTLDYTYEVGIGSNFQEVEQTEDISFDEVKKHVGDLMKLCSVLESSETITIKGKSASRIAVSQTQKVQFPLLIKSVSMSSTRLGYATT